MSRRVRLVLQAAPADCGPACAAMLLSEARQQAMTVDEVDELRNHAGRDGISVAGLRRMLGQAGMQTNAIRVTDPAALARLPGPQLLFWDGSGLWVCAKRLEKGRFRWPEADGEEAKIILSHEELALLIGGIDLMQTRRREWHRVTRAAA